MSNWKLSGALALIVAGGVFVALLLGVVLG